MSNVVTFIPKSEKAYTQNLSDFIHLCKEDLAVFSSDPEWHWDQACWRGAGTFLKHGHNFNSKNIHKAALETYLAPEFGKFARAYIRYRASTVQGQLSQFFLPLRALEAALIQVTGQDSIAKLNNVVLDEAAAKIREYTKVPSAQYDSGRRLQVIAEFIAEKALAPAVTWKHPFPSPKRTNSRLDRASKAERSSKLPSEAGIMALAEIFSTDPQNPQDRFTTSYAALLMCAPSRVSEVLDLSLTCIHRDKDSDGNPQIGLRWHAKKGGGHDIKYVPSSMQDIAVEAVRRLTELSAEGRKVAKWYEDHKGKFYRPEMLRDIPDDQPLTFDQLCLALNAKPNKKGLNEFVRAYLRKHPQLYEMVKENGGKITFGDLDQVARDALPTGFPYLNKAIGLKWSDALFCYRLNELHYKPVRPYELWMPSSNIFNSHLNSRHNDRQSIFERHGYTESDGSPITITSHQFRHYLNTLAQKGSLGELDIAKWSGRANIHQNNVYNHMTDDDHLERITRSGVMVKIGNPLLKIQQNDPNMPVTVADLDAATSHGDRIAHVTEWGFCVHDFAFSPCQKCADCLNCSEQVCIKGDDEKLKRLKVQRNLLIKQLQNALKAQDESTWGANRWVAHQTDTIERVEALIEILESDDVTEGAVIRLKNEHEDTPIKRMLGPDLDSQSEPPSGVSMDTLRRLLTTQEDNDG
ncbi:hypothetical protein [Neptuniibacter sp. QD37_11]|uniref:hypothetical protein n=1 Tax=Neptuniibacter sp. QD37_11 TaxID=3398209 RepID=UPI0039F62317